MPNTRIDRQQLKEAAARNGHVLQIKTGLIVVLSKGYAKTVKATGLVCSRCKYASRRVFLTQSCEQARIGCGA